MSSPAHAKHRKAESSSAAEQAKSSPLRALEASFHIESGRIRVIDPSYPSNTSREHAPSLRAISGPWKIEATAKLSQQRNPVSTVRASIYAVGDGIEIVRTESFPNIAIDSGTLGIFDSKLVVAARTRPNEYGQSRLYRSTLTALTPSHDDQVSGGWWGETCRALAVVGLTNHPASGVVLHPLYGEMYEDLTMGFDVDGKLARIDIDFGTVD